MVIIFCVQETKLYKCLAIQCVWKLKDSENFCFFKAKVCNSTVPRHYVMPLCQFPVDTNCYKNSDLVLIEQSEKDELFKVGQTQNKVYFGSRKEVNCGHMNIH